jgi:hypothetical protein
MLFINPQRGAVEGAQQRAAAFGAQIKSQEMSLSHDEVVSYQDTMPR